MHDLTQALAYIGAYCLGILSLLGAIAYFIKKDEIRKQKADEMAMAEAVGVVQNAMPGSTILS